VTEIFSVNHQLISKFYHHHQHQPISVTIKITPSSAVKMDKSLAPSQPRKRRGAAPPTAGPPAKKVKQEKKTTEEKKTKQETKIKQESFYDDVDRLMKSESSPIYKDATNLKVSYPFIYTYCVNFAD
jgi:hypothetical protein